MNSGSLFTFSGGSLEIFLALIFGAIGVFVFLYSLARVRGNSGQLLEYYIFLIVLLGSALGVVFARNLLFLFVCWELATVSLWRLVTYFREPEGVLAGNWAFYVNFIAAALMLVGLALVSIEAGTWDLGELTGRPLGIFPATLILVGILAKSATLPLYIWLPKAYRQAPAPVCALLSGVAENLGAVLFLKMFLLTMQVPKVFLMVTGTLAVISSLVAGGVALTSRTVRETLAYSTISQIGFILLGFACAGYYGILGGLLYIAGHAVAKSGLFFAAGVVEDAFGTGEFVRLGGFARNAPVLAAATGLLALSIMGLPPTLGFFAKVGVVIGAVKVNLLLGTGSLVAALFTMLYLSRLYSRVFLGASAVPQGEKLKISGFAVALVVVMAVLTVLLGVFWFIPVRFLSPAFGGFELPLALFSGGF